MEIEKKKVIKVMSKDLDLVARRRNELIIAKHRLSLQAQRLFLYVLSMVGDDHDEETEYEFAVNELASAIGIDRSNLYKSVVSVLEELASTMMTVQAIDVAGKAVPDRFVRIGLIKNRQQVRVTNEGGNRLIGSISVSIYKELLPYVRELKERYTQIELKYAFLLPSSYSLRLYDLLKLRAFTGRAWRVEREELRSLLSVSPNEYALWGDFRRSVLEKAQTDIGMHTDLAFDIEYISVGRAVREIVFRLRKEGGSEVELLPGTPKHAVFKSLLDLGVNVKVAEAALNEWWDRDPERVRWHLAEAKRMKGIGKISNPVGWFLSGLKKDYRPDRPLFTELQKQSEDKRKEYKSEGGLVLASEALQDVLGKLYQDVGRHNLPPGTPASLGQ